MKNELLIKLKTRITLALLLFPILTVFMLTSPLQTAWAACPAGIDDPVAYWYLDEDGTGTPPFADAFGISDATCGAANSVCPDQTLSERVINSQEFSGGDLTNGDGLTAADSADDFDWGAEDSFTISVWVKLTDSTATDVIIGRTDESGSPQLRWFLGVAPGGEATAFIQARNGEGSGSLITGTTVLTDNQWHHVALVRDNATNENHLYVDDGATPEASVTVDYTSTESPPGSGTGFNSDNPVTIGWLNVSTGFRLAGFIDEVAIYSQALSRDVIAQQHANGLIGLGYCNTAAPEITSTAGASATENVNYTYTPTVNNADMDVLTWSLTNAPTGMTVDSADGTITWEPLEGVLTSGSVTLTVDDGFRATDTEAINITVTPVNDAPEITSVAPTTATELVPLTYNATATDAESDTLTWSLTQNPAGMTVDSSSGVVTWTPPAGTPATVDVTLEVTDGNVGGTTTQDFTITVTNIANEAPTITSTAPVTATEEVEYTYTPTADDADGDTLTFTISDEPTGMVITAGVITWTPAAGSAGDVTYTVTVSDGASEDSEFVTVTVSAPGSSGGGGGSSGCFIGSMATGGRHDADTTGWILILSLFGSLLVPVMKR